MKWKGNTGNTTYGEPLPSRRGDYKMVHIPEGFYQWAPKPLPNTKRANLVKQEIADSFKGQLGTHPYWEGEDEEFINDYQLFYRDLFRIEGWIEKPTDRHNVVVSEYCCLTMVQYHNGILHAYSRSTDMKNGLHSDKLVLEYLAEVITKERPDCPVNQIYWYIAIPHEYVKPGIARLLEKEG